MAFHDDTELSEELVLVQIKALALGSKLQTELYSELASGSKSVLELNCGTGDRSLQMSQTSQVVAVDSSEAHLELARSRDTNSVVEWIKADPENVRLNRKFDLIVLGEYFFQQLLTDESQALTLATVVEHMNQHGRFILASRNPESGIEINASRKPLPNMLNHTGMGLIEAWNESEYNQATSVLTRTDGFDIIQMNKTISETSSWRYSKKDEMLATIKKAGLHPIKWLGDWSGQPWNTNSSDIILIGDQANTLSRMY